MSMEGKIKKTGSDKILYENIFKRQGRRRKYKGARKKDKERCTSIVFFGGL
jgi:hypothetical protein